MLFLFLLSNIFLKDVAFFVYNTYVCFMKKGYVKQNRLLVGGTVIGLPNYNSAGDVTNVVSYDTGCLTYVDNEKPNLYTGIELLGRHIFEGDELYYNGCKGVVVNHFACYCLRIDSNGTEINIPLFELKLSLLKII